MINTGAGGGDAEAGAKALDATFTAVWGGQNATPDQMGQHHDGAGRIQLFGTSPPGPEREVPPAKVPTPA